MSSPRQGQAGGNVTAGGTGPAAGPVGAGTSGPPSGGGPGGSPNGGPTSAPRRTRPTKRPPRLASLQLKRIDPWTVLKISLIVAIVMFFVWMIAIGIIYLVLGQMDVWTSVNETFATLTTAETPDNPEDLITPARVFTIAAVIGAINIVLFTALSTISAFVYNAAAGMAGGVELTLGERD